jgi:hypothetical protein
MLKTAVLLAGLLLTHVDDTVWWETTIGDVVEHRDQNTTTCTLALHDSQGEFAFIWARDVPTRIVIANRNWTLPSQTTEVAMRIGDVWLGDGDGAPNIPALTQASNVMLIANQPVEELLASAGELSLRTTERRFAIPLLRGKMAKLMSRLEQCRTAISQ